LQGQVTTNTTNIAGNTTAITNLQGQVGTNTTDIAGLQGQVAANTGAIATVQAGVATNAADIAALDASAVQYDDPSHDTVTFDGAGGTRLTNLADGTIAAGSTDAVTGSQLNATNQAVAALSGAVGLAVSYDDPSLATATLGGAGGTTIGNLTGGAVSAGSMEAVNGGQLFATNQQVGANTTAITSIDGRVTQNTTNIAGLTTQVGANTTSITAIDARVTQNTTQLAAVQAQVNNVPVGYVADGDGATPSATPTNTAAFEGANGGPVRVTNVAPGTLSATSTDAVNGSQLYATNQQVAQNRADIITISATIGAGSAAPLQYSNPATPTTANGGVPTQDVTLVGADPSVPVRLHNVADAAAPTDAVNLRQYQAGLGAMQQSLAQAFADANDYTDMRIAAISFDLAELRKDAHAGTAAAMAMAAIPQTMNVGESMFGGAVGHYRGQTAFGFGFSTTAGDKLVVKASGTFDTQGKGGVAAGAGFAF
jgi:autotransporter adhesin